MTRKQALRVAQAALREDFLAAGIEMVHTMPCGGDRSERHERAIARVKLISDAAPILAEMIEELPDE